MRVISTVACPMSSRRALVFLRQAWSAQSLPPQNCHAGVQLRQRPPVVPAHRYHALVALQQLFRAFAQPQLLDPVVQQAVARARRDVLIGFVLAVGDAQHPTPGYVPAQFMFRMLIPIA